jgi:hypothetical protein
VLVAWRVNLLLESASRVRPLRISRNHTAPHHITSQATFSVQITKQPTRNLRGVN